MAYRVPFQYALGLSDSAQFKYSLCIKKTIFRLLSTAEYSCPNIIGQVYGKQKMSTIKVTDTDFQETLQNNDLVLVDFWAPWCGPCKQIGPSLEEISDEMADKITVAKINIDENPNTPTQFGVRGIPTMLVFKNGEAAATKVGAVSKTAIVEWIEDSIA